MRAALAVLVLIAGCRDEERCAVHLDRATTGRCAEVGWVIADAALRVDAARLAHACSLAANLCAR